MKIGKSICSLNTNTLKKIVVGCKLTSIIGVCGLAPNAIPLPHYLYVRYEVQCFPLLSETSVFNITASLNKFQQQETCFTG